MLTLFTSISAGVIAGGAIVIPVNQSIPTISIDDYLAVGHQLTANPGTWTGTPSLSYIWFRGVTSVGSGSTYEIQAGDIGSTLMVREVDSVSDTFAVSDASSTIPSNDTSWSISFDTVVDMLDGATFNAVFGTTSIPVTWSIPSGAGMYLVSPPTEEITLPYSLTIGSEDMDVTFKVIAADGITFEDINLYVHVLSQGDQEQTTIVTNADTDGDLDSKYFVIYDNSNRPWAVYYNRGPIAEETTVECVASVNGSLHGSHFRIYGVENAPHAVVMDCGEIISAYEKLKFDFTGLTVSDFITGMYGKYVLVNDYEVTYCFWFNTGTEIEPFAVANYYVEVDASGPIPDIIDNLSTAIDAIGYTQTALENNSELYMQYDLDTAIANVPAQPGFPGVVTIITEGQVGRPPASTFAVGGVTNIYVSITDNATAGEVASAIQMATSMYFSVSTPGNMQQVHFINNYQGEVSNAYDVNTNFIISIDVAGRNNAPAPVGFYDTIPIGYLPNDSAATIAALTSIAINSLASDWSVTDPMAGDSFGITNTAYTAITDAYDYNTGFYMTTTWQGADPA